MRIAKKLIWVFAFFACIALAAAVASQTPEQLQRQRQAAAETKRKAAEAAKAKRAEQRQLAKLVSRARQLAKEQIRQAKLDRDEKLAALGKNATAEQKQKIETEYREEVAKINMRRRLEIEKQSPPKVSFPEDSSRLLGVSQIRFSGNTLVSTAELLNNIPVIYNASTAALDKAESKYIYDFTGIYEIILEPGTERQLSARTIQGLTQYVLSVYQSRNYAGIYVYVPKEALEQGTELEGGILPVQVIEAVVTDVTVTSYDPNQKQVEKGYLDSNMVLAWSPVKPGRVANQKKLDDFINLLNLDPDRYVSAVVSKGGEPKTLSVNYDIYEANPWHFFMQIDNSGTDDRKWSPRFGTVNTNLLGIDDTFIAMYQSRLDSGIEDNYSLFSSYDFPLAGPRLRLRIYGGYSEFDISPEAGDFDFIGGGKFIGGALKYNVLQQDGWFLDFSGSYSHEVSKSTPFFLGLSLPGLGYKVTMDLWGYAVNLYKSDDISNTSFSFSEVRSIGGMGSNDAEFANTRIGGGSAGTVFPDNDFSIATVAGSYSRVLDANRVQRLSTNFRLIYPSERLAPAKMTTFGGMYTVRGYDEYEVVADGGMLASAQYEFDLVKYERSKGIQPAESEKTHNKLTRLKKLAPLAFIDFGRTRIENPRSTERRHQTLFSVGVGTLLELGDHFSGQLYYGCPLRETDDTRVGRGRLHVGLWLRW